MGPRRSHFQDINDITGKPRRMTGYRKIQFCGEQAQRDGLEYFWVGRYCIDKASSAELSEEINSIFRQYEKAEECYVYLEDVSAFGSHSWHGAFKNRKWFPRGWTFQELAPSIVQLYSREKVFIGDKYTLWHLICEATGFPSNTLYGTPLSQFPLEQRLLWLKTRETTVAEDLATVFSEYEK
jgi:hypothetical protein